METTGTTQIALLPYRHSAACEIYFAGLAAFDMGTSPDTGDQPAFTLHQLMGRGDVLRRSAMHRKHCDCGQRALRIVEEQLRILRKAERAGREYSAAEIARLVERRDALRAELEVTV